MDGVSFEIQTYRNAIQEQTIIMRENSYAPETYFVFSIINFAEMVCGLMMGFYAIFVNTSWFVGFFGHLLSLAGVGIGSIWIWFFYSKGVRGEEGKFTMLNT